MHEKKKKHLDSMPVIGDPIDYETNKTWKEVRRKSEVDWSYTPLKGDDNMNVWYPTKIKIRQGNAPEPILPEVEWGDISISLQMLGLILI